MKSDLHKDQTDQKRQQPKDWLNKSEAADLISVSTDTIERRMIPWQDDPVPYKVRVKFLRLGEDTRELPRFYREDVEAFLHAPDPQINAGRPRKLFEQ